MFFQCIFVSLQVILAPMLCRKPLHLCKQWSLRERLLLARLERWNSFIFFRRKPKSLRTWSLCYGKLKLVFTLTSLTYLPLMGFRRYHLATQLFAALNLMLWFKQNSLVKEVSTKYCSSFFYFNCTSRLNDSPYWYVY